MPSKLALHFQQLPGWAGQTNALWVKVMDPPSENRWPGRRAIGRCYTDDWRSNELVAKGAAGAEEWFNFCQPFFARAPYVHAWEGPNEPQPVADLGFARALGAFTARLADLMHGQGLKLVGGCLSEGNPGGNEPQRRACFQAIATGLAKCDYWSQHCYWVLGYDHPQAGMNLQYAAQAGIALPPLLITECGIDGGIVDRAKTGWKTYCYNDSRVYMAQLAAFDRELAKDPYALVATIFTAGPNGDWADFEIDEETSRMVDLHITSAGGPYAAGAPPAASSLADGLRERFGENFNDLTASLPHNPNVPPYATRPLIAIQNIDVHHTATTRAITWPTVAGYHVNTKKWYGIAYHIGVRLYNGVVTVSLLNAPETVSYHAQAGNTHDLAVCFMGDYTKTAPEQSEIDAGRDVIAIVRAFLGRAIPVRGHRDVPNNDTTCPGDLLEARLGDMEAPESILDKEIWRIAVAARCISPNPNSALEKKMRATGYTPIGNEAAVFLNDVRQGVTQMGYDPDTGRETAYFATNKSGEWVVRTVGP